MAKIIIKVDRRHLALPWASKQARLSVDLWESEIDCFCFLHLLLLSKVKNCFAKIDRCVRENANTFFPSFSTYLPSQTFYTISFFVPRWCLFLSVFVFAPSDKVLGLAQPNIWIVSLKYLIHLSSRKPFRPHSRWIVIKRLWVWIPALDSTIIYVLLDYTVFEKELDAWNGLK